MKKTVLKILRNWKKILWGIVIIYIVYITIDVVFFDKEVEDKGPKQHIEIFESTLKGYSKNGGTQWEFTAEEIETTGSEKSIAKKVKKGIIFRDKKPHIDLKAPKIEIDLQTQNFYATGGVMVLVLETGQEIQADNLRWDSNREIMRAQGKIVATYKDNVLTGDNLIYNVKDGKYEMEDGVRFEFDLELD